MQLFILCGKYLTIDGRASVLAKGNEKEKGCMKQIELCSFKRGGGTESQPASHLQRPFIRGLPQMPTSSPHLQIRTHAHTCTSMSVHRHWRSQKLLYGIYQVC